MLCCLLSACCAACVLCCVLYVRQVLDAEYVHTWLKALVLTGPNGTVTATWEDARAKHKGNFYCNRGAVYVLDTTPLKTTSVI